jgi:(1->4)-alpha-D-glucan 1-alpha-D-glucosylmutase
MGADAMQSTPVASYRLQLHAGFTFADAQARIPYLAALGISHLYLSPILQAAEGSKHGYDLVDPTRISEELGGRNGFEQLAAAARDAGLALILDIVPNHMCISDRRNKWWWDVLEHGQHSRFAHLFDVDWQEPLILPVLGDHLWRVLERHELLLVREGPRLMFAYGPQRFPLSPVSVEVLLAAASSRCDNERLKLLAHARLAVPKDQGAFDALLAEVLEQSPEAAAAVNAALQQDVSQLLDLQHYRLSFWRSAMSELDYRRFFDIASLVALRTEDPRVLDLTHSLIADLPLEGLRVDHVDGLADPRAYLTWLRALKPHALIWVEKILADGEPLKPWPVQGTTGYDFLNQLTALCLDPKTEAPLLALAKDLAGQTEPFVEAAARAQEQVLTELFATDVRRLVRLLISLRERYPQLRDYSRHELKAALRALLVAFPVYRSYVQPQRGTVDEGDARVIEQALEAARARNVKLDPFLFDFLGRVLKLEHTGLKEAELVRRFQQLCAPAVAKGVEDTALYRDVKLLALDEVGGSPARYSLSAGDMHALNQRALAQWPLRMLATSSHDTKRSEDSRARLVAMAHRPERFDALARDFFGLCDVYRRDGAPEKSLVMLALQTLVGAWPLSVQRFSAALLKSAREMKTQTRWLEPNPAYEAAVDAFAHSVMSDPAIHTLLERFVGELMPAERTVCLAWALLKCTCPGMPDLYQGSELWQHLLVDPDNRRSVDWTPREAALGMRERPSLERDARGLNKLHVLRTALKLRRDRPSLFGPQSRYLPLQLSGAHEERAFAFARLSDEGCAITAVTRWPAADWGDTTLHLPDGTFSCLLSDTGRFSGTVRLARLFERLPVALLV